jgi:hypothetical protein
LGCYAIVFTVDASYIHRKRHADRPVLLRRPCVEEAYRLRDDFKVSEGHPGLLLQAMEKIALFRRKPVRHPAIAVTGNTDKERSAAINFLETNLDGLADIGLLLRDTPLRSISTSRNRLSSHHCLSLGKVTLTRWSRSACMSRKVEEI